MRVVDKKCPPDLPPANLIDYEATRARFTWDAAQQRLASPSGGLNIASVAVDRHAVGADAERVALRCLGCDGHVRDVTYGALAAQSNRFANLLHRLDVAAGDTVFTLLGRVPELYLSALGSWKAHAVFCPLFSAFGPEPLYTRLSLGKARVLVTTAELYRRKVAELRVRLPHLEHVFIVPPDDADPPPGTQPLGSLLDAESPDFAVPATDPETPALLHFTSGTTGRPKGAIHVHAAVVTHHETGRFALDLHAGDVFWCTADPGWVTGISYGVIAPLTAAATSIIDDTPFDVAHWYALIRDHRVTVWYTAPTAIRVMMRYGTAFAREHDLSSLRFVASVGEPLHPEAVTWGLEALGHAIHDNWWQTETGGIMIANCRSVPIRPGSMGRPLPGIDATIVQRDGEQGLTFVTQPDTVGELALRAGWPSMFRGYLGEEARYRACFADGWYLSGDLARRDADGYYWFVGRADDVIKTSGHLVGPFEVESALLGHPAVVDAAVIGVPDPIAGEQIKAFVVLRSGNEMDERLRRELLAHARRRLGPALAPRQIESRHSVPKTRSGKIMRRLLRAQELGLPEGDLSMLLENHRPSVD